MKNNTGGCLCGKIRYETTGDPALVAVCHCKNCQKQAGTAFSIIAGWPRASVKVTGDIATYRDKGDSGLAVLRKFCSTCGSPILSDAEGMPALSFVKAGTLDDTSWLKPSVHVFCDSKQPWVQIEAGVPQVPRNPS